MDRSIDRLLSGFPFESFPPLLATCVAAPAQSLLVARAGALIQSKKLRISFFILLGVLILFEFVCSVLVTTANLLVRTSPSLFHTLSVLTRLQTVLLRLHRHLSPRAIQL